MLSIIHNTFDQLYSIDGDQIEKQQTFLFHKENDGPVGYTQNKIDSVQHKDVQRRHYER